MPLAHEYMVGPPRGPLRRQGLPCRRSEAPSLGRPGERLGEIRRVGQAGFTLIELLVVVAMIAIASATVSLSLRDPAAAQLEREAERLSALFETARAESRAAGLSVSWQPVRAGDGSEDQFRFQGLPKTIQLPRRWLGQPVSVEIARANVIRLGPEPLIGAQQLRLSLGSQRLILATDGLSPFEVKPADGS